MTTSREQFEQAFEDVTGWELSEHPDRSYCEDLNLIWEAAWAASRAALVVDIASHTEFEIEHMISPEKDGYSIGWIDGRNYSAEQVRAAGITVKGDSDETNADAS